MGPLRLSFAPLAQTSSYATDWQHKVLIYKSSALRRAATTLPSPCLTAPAVHTMTNN